MIHENQTTDWQRQLNFDVSQNTSNHSHSTQSSHTNNENNNQHDLQDIFGRSTKRPISAPPTSDEINGSSSVRTGFSSATNLSQKSWGNGDSTTSQFNQTSHSHNDLKEAQHFHLPNHLNFDKRSDHEVNSSDSLSFGIFSSNIEDNNSNNSNSSSSLNNLTVMNGLRRPASTGVIGNSRSMNPTSSSVMESLGLASTHTKSSKLDLIQEDFPKTPSPEYTLHETKNNGSNSTSTSSLQYGTQRDPYHNSHSSAGGNASSLPVPSIQYHTRTQKHTAEEPYSIQQQQRTMYTPSSTNVNNYDGNNLVELQHMYGNVSSMHHQVQQKYHLHGHSGQSHQHQQHGSPTRQDFLTSLPSGSTYLGSNGLHHHPQQVMRQHATFEQQPVYYDAQRRSNAVSGPPRIIPAASNSQQPIFVNPNPYGTYATVQYHQGHPQSYQPNPVVIHPHDPSLASRLISMPVQGQIPAQVSTNGAYIYFHQPSDATAINILQTNSNRRHQFKAPPKVTNERSRKHNRVKRSGSDSQDNGVNEMLEQFRAEKNRSWTAMDVKGHIVEFCQDQNGSRFIQQRLEVATIAEKESIMEEVLPEISKLRVDIFGNYVVQKLFDFGTPDMVDKLKQTIVGDMLDLSKQIYGCRVVQKALEIVNDESLLELLTELHNNLLSCIHDQNGNHVIQKCVEVINSRATIHRASGNMEMEQLFKKETQLLMDCVTEDILRLSCHPYGCRVFQRILEHFDDEQKRQILDCLRRHHKNLLDDQYGNYVIQHVLRYGQTVDQDSVLDIVVNNSLLQLSRQKFASNVVEKLLKYGNDGHRRVIVREMLKVAQINGIDGSKEESSVVLMMVRDAYANYVVQTTLDVVPEGEEKRMLFEELNNNSSLLRNFTFAKHIITKLGAN